MLQIILILIQSYCNSSDFFCKDLHADLSLGSHMCQHPLIVRNTCNSYNFVFDCFISRCCEKTMEVMRNNQEALLTILEVLLYDPLYAWTISPAKAYALQQRRDRNDPDTLDINNTTGDLMDLAEASNRTNNSEED